MVIDTSALLALLFNEPDADPIEVALDADPVRLMSVASCLETAIVVEANWISSCTSSRLSSSRSPTSRSTWPEGRGDGSARVGTAPG